MSCWPLAAEAAGGWRGRAATTVLDRFRRHGAGQGGAHRRGLSTWGYTAQDGSRYALMGTAKGVLVLDLRDAASPRVVDEIDGPTDTHQPGIYWREMRVYGSHAYIVSEHSNVRGGIMILDLASLL
ncbi:hypothetical protein LP419_36100 [Massilia sp. H-1]|nr:hypothetical protein LP419_36100 [Massilia sp. H-1]